MKSRIQSLLALLFSLALLFGFSLPVLACTSIPVTKEASADGSTMTAHTCDGWYDARTWVVPAADHKPGETATVWKNLLHADRTTPEKLGEIPQVPHTYKWFFAGYPYMNENQVIMGETTIGNRKELETTEGVLYIEMLQIFALERAKTAREAIKIMGELAETYGYCDRGECLTVGDPNEVWQFEIMPPGVFKKGAIWAAQRIPAGHVGVSANRARIGKIEANNPNYFMFSKNIFAVAEENGWWSKSSGDPFLYYDAYNPKDALGSRQREWRVLSWAAPSLKLDVNSPRFPFSVKAERKITVQDMMKIYRDTNEGVPDLDKANVRLWYVSDGKGGVVKSPFATPHPGADMQKLLDIPSVRNISIPGCSYHTILQARGWLPNAVGGICWFGLNNPDTSTYVPIYAGVSKLPATYATNDRTKFTRDSAWWAFDWVDNLVNQRYQEAIKDLRAVRDPLEAQQFAMQSAIEKVAAELYKTDPDLAVQFLTNYTNSRCNIAVEAFWKLGEFLLTKYDEKMF